MSDTYEALKEQMVRELGPEALELYEKIESLGQDFGFAMIRARLDGDTENSHKLLLKLSMEPAISLATNAFLADMVAVLLRGAPGAGFTDDTPASEIMAFWSDVMRQQKAEAQS